MQEYWRELLCEHKVLSRDYTRVYD